MSEQKDVCCSGEAKTLVMACSGGSNAGQIANNVMIELDKKGVGNAYCITGIGAALSGFVESAKAARTIVIDGCAVACSKKALEKHGIVPSRYFVITELGIEKNHDFNRLADETKAVLKTIESSI